MLKNNDTRKEVQKAQNKIEMGMKRRQLQADEEVLNKRKKYW